MLVVRASAAWALSGALALFGCGGRAREQGDRVIASICEFPGARDAELPLEVTRFGSFAMGATSRAVYMAESLGEARVVRVPRQGGPFTVLGTNLFYVEIRTSGEDVYVIAAGFAGNGSALYRVSADRLVLLDADLKGANDLAVTPTRLYLSDAYTGNVFRYDRNGAGRTLVASGVGTTHLAADGETLYYLGTSKGTEGLFRLEADLSSTLLWGSILNSPSRLFFQEGRMYAGGSGIHAYDLAALSDETVCEGPAGVGDIVRVEDTFYFTSGSFQGDLLRVPVAGGTPEVLDRELGYGGIATDGVSVFYDSGTSALAYCPPLEEGP